MDCIKVKPMPWCSVIVGLGASTLGCWLLIEAYITALPLIMVMLS